MKDKIVFLMEREGLTTTRLAEILEAQPSSVSHLVSGRNKPSFDLLQKILHRFPRINPDWLLLDAGEYYRADAESTTPIDMTGDEFSSESGDFAKDGVSSDEYASNDTAEKRFTSGAINSIKSISSQKYAGKSPIFVVMFYDDGSCESFSMR